MALSDPRERVIGPCKGFVTHRLRTVALALVFTDAFADLLISFGGPSLRNNKLHLLQVVSSFLDSTYSEDAARNCAVYKANKTLLPTDCASKHEWICKIPRGIRPLLYI